MKNQLPLIWTSRAEPVLPSRFKKVQEEAGRVGSARSDRNGILSKEGSWNDYVSMDTTVRRAGSMRSIQSAWSMKRERIAALMGKRSILVEGAKLAALTFLPLAVVFGLCIKSLLNADNDIRAAKSIHASVERSQDIGTLVSALLKERGLRCQYLALVPEQGDEVAATAVLPDLRKAENATDGILGQIYRILPPSFSNFANELAQFRSYNLEDDESFSCANVTEWYSNHTRTLEEECSRPFSAGATDSFWSEYFAYSAMLIAQDMIGLQRALGSNYFGDGSLTPRNYVYFAKNVGGAEAIMKQVSSVLYPPAAAVYDNMTAENSELMAEMDENVDFVLQHALEESDSSPVLNASRYFNSVTAHIDIVSFVEGFIRDRMLDDVTSERKSRMIEFQVMIVLVILVLVISPAFTTWYAFRSREMMKKIADFTDRLKEQKSQLSLERKKAELLLCQMLPKSVVTDMAQNKPIVPEGFEEATVFFSHVDEFAAFVMRSEPFQVVDVLNQLYNRCDDILDQYDAYKVETIGDSYMIASGVPKRNGHRHSAEIATIALHFLMMMESFQVPTLPEEKMTLTIGIHTGQVVAGIMGIKQQRYCLFGDTVNIASRMMSSGLASRIHLSPKANEHLQKHHHREFTTKLRGPVAVKGKGILITHWLVGSRGFPYTVQMKDESQPATTSVEKERFQDIRRACSAMSGGMMSRE